MRADYQLAGQKLKAQSSKLKAQEKLQAQSFKSCQPLTARAPRSPSDFEV
jgi:hypothetical protein